MLNTHKINYLHQEVILQQFPGSAIQIHVDRGRHRLRADRIRATPATMVMMTMTTVMAIAMSTTMTITLVVMTGALAAPTVSADGAKMPSPSQPCGLCPPGHHVSLPCSTKASEEQQEQQGQQQQLLLEDADDVETRCTPCPPRHYTQFSNSLDRCRYCGPPCKEGQRLAKECSPTHDRVCECEPGTFLLNEFCVRHSSCAAGHGVVTKGSPHEDTHCAPCPRGFFSPEASADATCRPHTDCSSLGSTELLPGASTHDALCWSCRQRRASARSREHGDTRPAGDDGAEPPSSSLNLPPQPEGPCNAATLQFVDSVRHLVPPCLARHKPEVNAYIRKLLLSAVDNVGKQRHGRRKQGGKKTKQGSRMEKHVKKLLLRVCARRTSQGGSVRIHGSSLRRKTAD
ncbi:unnamed protein product [Lampetra planeri]